MKEPKVRKDGLCAHCRGERKLSGLTPVYRLEAERDPFCSARCCQDWHAERRTKETAA